MYTDKDRYFLELALKEAELSLQENTYPVGAIIVDENDQIIGKGRNGVHPLQDITAHAEIVAMREAGSAMFDAKIQDKRLTLYSSLEPCPMCTGAILFAKIQRVVWLLNDDHGFGGYKKIKDSLTFEKKFSRIEMVEEPDQELKDKQLVLMGQWENNPKHIKNLREQLIK